MISLILENCTDEVLLSQRREIEKK